MENVTRIFELDKEKALEMNGPGLDIITGAFMMGLGYLKEVKKYKTVKVSEASIKGMPLYVLISHNILKFNDEDITQFFYGLLPYKTDRFSGLREITTTKKALNMPKYDVTFEVSRELYNSKNNA